MMLFHRTASRWPPTAGIAALALLLAACHGASSGNAPPLPAGAPSVVSNAPDSGQIISSCGHRVRIVLAGIVTCRFHEVGDPNATFKLKDDTHGLILISPLTGNSTTNFTITGLVIGSGHFTVHAGRPARLVVRVRVVL